MKKGPIKICPACEANFSCEGENDCWCENLQILKKDILLIMNSYTECLCPECLARYTTE
jgi:hypothetical protein